MSGSATVLVLRALGLGDALTGVPALRGLRRAHPHAHLVLAAPAPIGGWLRHLGVVDEVLPASGLAPLRWPRAAPELAVNLHGRGPQSHALLRALRPQQLVAFAPPDMDPHDVGTGPAWPADAHEVERWCSLVRWSGGPCGPQDLFLPGTAVARGTHVVVHPGATSGSRRWPASRWQDVATALASRGHDVFVTGTAEEAAPCAETAAGHPRVRDVSGQLELPALSELVGSAALLLCGDTGLAHLATAYRTPSVLLFGPTDPARWGPLVDRDRHVVLWDPRAGDPAGDPHGTEVDPRLMRIHVPRVLRAAERLLSLPRALPA